MRKIIPFRKEILFKTKLKEVTSISLEHDYKVNDDNITGEFLVSGDYKITSSSINREEFNYTIPFEIDLDNKYDTKTINLDIENFYYEIIDEEILKVSIDVFVEGEYKKEEVVEIIEEPKKEIVELPEIKDFLEEDRNEKDIEDQDNNKDISIINDSEIEINAETINNNDKEIINNNININNNDNTSKEKNNINLFDNINMEDTYATYHVYIVKEDDTIDTILNKYNITKEELENYNDISSIKYQDKLIIPSINE